MACCALCGQILPKSGLILLQIVEISLSIVDVLLGNYRKPNLTGLTMCLRVIRDTAALHVCAIGLWLEWTGSRRTFGAQRWLMLFVSHCFRPTPRFYRYKRSVLIKQIWWSLSYQSVSENAIRGKPLWRMQSPDYLPVSQVKLLSNRAELLSIILVLCKGY